MAPDRTDRSDMEVQVVVEDLCRYYIYSTCSMSFSFRLRMYPYGFGSRTIFCRSVYVDREWTAIQKDLPENVVLLVKDKDHLRRLDDLPRKRNRGGGRHARRLASRRGTEFPMRVDALFQQRPGPWLDQDIFRLEIGHDVCEIARNHCVFDVLGLSQRIGQRPPDSRQIHLAVAGFRRTRRQIQFPVARARDRGKIGRASCR